MSAQAAKWSAKAPSVGLTGKSPRLIVVDDLTPVPSIDNPPPFNGAECQSAIGRAVHKLEQGQRIPMDLAQDLMDQGFDVPTLTRSYE